MSKELKKNPLAAIILASGKPEKEKSEKDESDSGDSDMKYDSATDELMEALEKGDHDGVKEALKSFVDLCMNGDGEGEKEDSYS